MLPFEEKTWAKPVAKFMITMTLIAEAVAVLWLRHYGPLDPPEIVALLLILVGVLPPNIHILRRTSGITAPSPVQSGPMPLQK